MTTTEIKERIERETGFKIGIQKMSGSMKDYTRFRIKKEKNKEHNKFSFEYYTNFMRNELSFAQIFSGAYDFNIHNSVFTNN